MGLIKINQDGTAQSVSMDALTGVLQFPRNDHTAQSTGFPRPPFCPRSIPLCLFLEDRFLRHGKRSAERILIAKPKKKGKQLELDTEWTKDRIEENKVHQRRPSHRQ